MLFSTMRGTGGAGSRCDERSELDVCAGVTVGKQQSRHTVALPSSCHAIRLRVARHMAHPNAPRDVVRHALHGNHYVVGVATRTVLGAYSAGISVVCVGGATPDARSAYRRWCHCTYCYVGRSTFSKVGSRSDR